MKKLVYRRVQRCLLIVALLTIGYSALAQVTTPDFSVVVLPDTQYYSESYPAIFNAQTQWIVNNSANYNIQFVLGEGDIVNVANTPAQWQNADAAVKLLDNAKIPYVLPLGNHDYDNFNPSARGTTAFNTYFGPSRYAQYTWYMGGFPSGTNDNFYAVFTINGQQYLILALEFLPRQESLDWAKTVLDANPDKEIIVVTHSFLFTDSTRGDQCNNNDNGGSGNNQGEDVWQKLLINYPNLSLVLNGHFTGNNASQRVDLGLQQNLVNEIFANYQGLTNGGNGWMRILTYRPLLNRIDIVTYSPYLNQYKTDSTNQFSITWHSTGVANTTGTIGGMVRGQRTAPTLYQCVPISGATLSAGGESATSATDGSFSLALSPDNYTLSAAATGWTATSDYEEPAFPAYTSSAKVFLEPLTGTVAGKVTDTSGNPVTGANVAFSGGTIPTQTSATAGTTGSYTASSISAGSYSVTASATGLTTATATTTVTAGATTTLNIKLSGGSTGGSCAGSTVNRTVTICSPVNGATVTSPVSIVAQVTDSAAISQTGIYIDSVQKYQTPSTSVNTSLPLTAGAHRLVVQARDSAGTFKTTINITVSSSSGGSCAGSGVNRTVTICSPINNATVTSPASIVAQATDSTAVTQTQIYVDQVKQYQVSGGSVNTSLPLAAGTHSVTVLAQDSAGTFQNTVNVTVPSTGGTCSAPTSPGVNICQPASGATVSSPLTVQAAAAVTGTISRMEIWIDGVKKYSQTGSAALSTSLTMTTGTHRFAVLAYNTAGTKWEQAYNATVM